MNEQPRTTEIMDDPELSITKIPVCEDYLEVIPQGRFWWVFINGQLLTRNKTVETTSGSQVKTVPREFMTDLQAWGFLGEIQRTYKRTYGVDLGWKIKGEV